MLAIKVQVFIGAGQFSWMIGVVTQTILPHQRWCRKRRSRNRKPRHCQVGPPPPYVFKLLQISVFIISFVCDFKVLSRNIIKMAVKTRPITKIKRCPAGKRQQMQHHFRHAPPVTRCTVTIKAALELVWNWWVSSFQTKLKCVFHVDITCSW